MIRLAAWLLFATSLPAHAAADGKGPQRTLQEPLDGVVLDQTVSAAGYAFYAAFCAFWHDKPLAEQFALAVRERASSRRGSQVVVEYAGRVLFQGALPGRGDVLPLGRHAVDVAYETAVNAQVQRLLFVEDELAPDEF